jgi:hypothetical protein
LGFATNINVRENHIAGHMPQDIVLLWLQKVIEQMHQRIFVLENEEPIVETY